MISVIIINFNSGPRLAKCLDALARQTNTDFEVIIFDNASDDGSTDNLGDFIFPLTFIHSHENIGFAAGNNRAAQQAKEAWLAFLNPDAYASPEWLEKLQQAINKYPYIDAFGSTQIDALEPTKIDGAGDVYHAFGVPWRGGFGQAVEALPQDGECFAPCAAAALYRREVFEALGGFDERFFCYGEDVDLGFRLRLSGRRAVQLRDAVVYHEGSAISGRYSPFTVYHGNRNRIWGWFMNMPLVLMVPLLPFHLFVNLYLLIRSFSVGIGKAYWRAMIDGYGGLWELRKSRRERQRARSVSIKELMGALTWSPLKVSRRAIDLKPISSIGNDN